MAGLPVPRAASGMGGGVAVGERVGERVGVDVGVDVGVGVGVGVVSGWLDVDGSGAGTGAVSLLQPTHSAATNPAPPSKATSRTVPPPPTSRCAVYKALKVAAGREGAIGVQVRSVDNRGGKRRVTRRRARAPVAVQERGLAFSSTRERA